MDEPSVMEAAMAEFEGIPSVMIGIFFGIFVLFVSVYLHLFFASRRPVPTRSAHGGTVRRDQSGNLRRVPPPGVDWHKGQKKMNSLLPPRNGERYAVIGVGNVGRWVVELLLQRGEREILLLDIVSPDLDLRRWKEDYGEDSVSFRKTDVTSVKQLEAALGEGRRTEDQTEDVRPVDAVFLTMALISYNQRMPFQYPLSHKVNVVGTQNVLDVCVEFGIKRLIQTSTSNVIVGPNTTAETKLTEETPYLTEFFNHYAPTKVLAEKAVISSDKINGLLRTTAIRPCSGVFGHRDRIATQMSIDSKIASVVFPSAVIDFVYVENVALGHLMADEKLRNPETADQVGGEIFHISNNEPIANWEFNSSLTHFDPTMDYRILPLYLIKPTAYAVEWLQWIRYKTGGRWSLGNAEIVTPATIKTASLSYVMNSDKATRVLGYSPAYTMDEGLQKTLYLAKETRC
mmetsp:Transcript_17687/g.24587  ORF Transcript_17687/g.24587 Transcript_17687/m.24587 type:complete len:458 (+) Transcript_17687:160-1533(+)